MEDEHLFCAYCGARFAVPEPEKFPEQNAYALREENGEHGAQFGADDYEPVPRFETVPQFAAGGRDAVQKKRHVSLGLLIWSVALFFFPNLLGTPLCAAAALFAAMSNEQGAQDSARKRRISLILCVVATIVDADTVIAAVLFAVFAARGLRIF